MRTRRKVTTVKLRRRRDSARMSKKHTDSVDYYTPSGNEKTKIPGHHVSLLTTGKDSDHTKNEKPKVSVPEKSQVVHKCQLLIIGAGAQTVAVLSWLAQARSPPSYHFHIIVVEKKSIFGPGRPYDKHVQIDQHLMNVFSSEAAFDFMDWLDSNDYGNEFAEAPPRHLYGKYLISRFHKFVEHCRARKFLVTLINNTEAETIAHDQSESGFVVELSGGVTIHTRDVFLATGHWDPNRFQKPPKGYFESPFPAWKLKDIPANARVGVFGTNFNGIDAVLTLAHGRGEFVTGEDGKLVYNTTHQDFEIKMYSPVGQLPLVAPKYPQDYRVTTIAHVAAERPPVAELKYLFDLMKRDAKQFLPSVGDIENLAPKQFFDRVDRVLLPGVTPEERFTSVFRLSQTKGEESVPKLLHFFRTYKLIFAARFATAEDTLTFQTQIAPRIANNALPMPLSNAGKLLALIEAGCLSLHAVGDNSELTRKGDRGVRLTYEGGHADHDYFVDAEEQSGRVGKDPRKLTISLLDNGLAKAPCIPYEKQDHWKRIKCHVGDGVEMDTETMRVQMPDNSSSGFIYAFGPFVNEPFAQSLASVVDFARKAVYDVEQSIKSGHYDSVAQKTKTDSLRFS